MHAQPRPAVFPVPIREKIFNLIPVPLLSAAFGADLILVNFYCAFRLLKARESELLH